VDLKENSVVQPTHYTLKTYKYGNGSYPRSWVLEAAEAADADAGCFDAASSAVWTVLDEQEGTDEMSGSCKTHTFQIPEQVVSIQGDFGGRHCRLGFPGITAVAHTQQRGLWIFAVFDDVYTKMVSASTAGGGEPVLLEADYVRGDETANADTISAAWDVGHRVTAEGKHYSPTEGGYMVANARVARSPARALAAHTLRAPIRCHIESVRSPGYFLDVDTVGPNDRLRLVNEGVPALIRPAGPQLSSVTIKSASTNRWVAAMQCDDLDHGKTVELVPHFADASRYRLEMKPVAGSPGVYSFFSEALPGHYLDSSTEDFNGGKKVRFTSGHPVGVWTQFKVIDLDDMS
jgi:hypothetical protein